MTKTLTEQWKDGELPAGLYYFRKNDGLVYIEFHDDYRGFCTPEEYIKEVLAPVPSYDEIKEMRQKIERLEFDNEALEMAHNEGKEINDELVSKTEQLEKKLEIATKALKEYADRTNWIEGNFMYVCDGTCFADEESAEQALKEMEGVK